MNVDAKKRLKEVASTDKQLFDQAKEG